MKAFGRAKTALALAAQLSSLASAQAQVSPPDCITAAAIYHHVNPVVLRAMAFNESTMRPWVVNKNSNGTYDIGLFQINGIHAGELAKFGIGPSQLTDACVSAYVGGWLYRKKVDKHGNTWKAVGAYHSETPALRDEYSQKIYKIVKSWGGALP